MVASQPDTGYVPTGRRRWRHKHMVGGAGHRQDENTESPSLQRLLTSDLSVPLCFLPAEAPKAANPPRRQKIRLTSKALLTQNFFCRPEAELRLCNQPPGCMAWATECEGVERFDEVSGLPMKRQLPAVASER